MGYYAIDPPGPLPVPPWVQQPAPTPDPLPAATGTVFTECPKCHMAGNHYLGAPIHREPAGRPVPLMTEGSAEPIDITWTGGNGGDFLPRTCVFCGHQWEQRR